MEGVELGLGRPVRAEVGVGPCEVLAVVDGEVHVVQRVVGGAVEELLGPVARDHVAVVDQDGPYLDCDEQNQVQIPLHWAEEDEDAASGLVMMTIRCDSDVGMKLTGMAETARSRQGGGTPEQPMGWELSIR